ncbi:MAG: NUDIX domain-containing protein [Thermodesulfobacteriota bacterium]
MAARVNHREPLYRGRVFNMDRENVSLENGVTLDMDIIRHPGASAIVPLIDSGRSVILIRQYRHAVGGYIWEIPAGTLDPDETPLVCAQRELIEETGYAADRWEKLGEVVPVPGYADERIHLFSADGLHLAEQHLDADEILDVHEIKLERVLKMVDGGEIQDAKTLTGLFLLTRRRQGAAG